jgi:hypothetical protein
MKRLALSITLLALLPVCATAHQNSSAANQQATESKHSTKTATLAGKSSNQGASFTGERDARIWRVINPEVLANLDGLAVKVRAEFNRLTGEMHIVSVQLREETPAFSHSQDSAFRR